MLDLNKPVQTRDGRPARIICTDRKSDTPYSIIALVECGPGQEKTQAYTIEGRWLLGNDKHSADLINAPVKHTGWMNVYESVTGPSVHKTRTAADAVAGPFRVACIRVEFTEGEGL